METRKERLYGKDLQVKAVSKETGVSEDTVSAVYDAVFKTISDKIMAGKTVQVPDFGNFKLKHLDRRATYNYLTQGVTSVADEHLKIHFMAYTDLKRRATRKLKRQKAREENKEA